MPARQLLISVLLIAALLGAPAHARQTYFGGNLALLTYDVPDLEPALDVSGVYGKVGLGDERGVFRGELRLGFVNGEHDHVTAMIRGDESSTRLEVSGNWIGAYALIGMPVESMVRPYAFLGYSITDWSEDLCYEVPIPDGSYTMCGDVGDDADDISFGFGVDLNVGNDWTVNIEYAMYLDQSDVIEVDGLSVGISLPFRF